MSNSNSDARIVIIGAGSGTFGLSMLGDLMTKGYEPLRGSTIVLHDLNEEKLKKMSTVFTRAVKEAEEDEHSKLFTIESTTNPQIALKDAKYCITAIEHGDRIECWKQDYYVPLKYGSRQIFGENGGTGGAFHAWRQIPPFLELMHKMEDLCPKAWVLNLSNPMHRITWAATKASKMKVVGLCHGVSMGISDLEKILGVKYGQWDAIAAGINHFYFFVKAWAKENLELPPIGSLAKTKITKGEDLLDIIRGRGLIWSQQKEFPLIETILKNYGYLTFPHQSHPGEYIPWANMYCPQVKYDWQKFLQGVEADRSKMQQLFDGVGNNYWWTHPSEERAIDVIIGMEHNTQQYEIAVNLPNNETITNLPSDCCVETPATVDRNGIHPIKIGNLPDGIQELLLHEINVQRLVVNAALKEDANLAIQALTLDGMLAGPQVAEAVFKELCQLQKDVLPYFKYH